MTKFLFIFVVQFILIFLSVFHPLAGGNQNHIKKTKQVESTKKIIEKKPNNNPLNKLKTEIKNEEKMQLNEIEAAPTLFENDYLKIKINPGWEIEELSRKIQKKKIDPKSGQMIDFGEPIYEKTGGIKIKNNNYVLMIHPNYTLPVPDYCGDFSQIARGIKGPDLIFKSYTYKPCGTTVKESISENLFIEKIYLDPKKNNYYCNIPSGESPIWYFSYISTEYNGYIGDKQKLNPHKLAYPERFVIAITYETEDINNFPQKDSTQLKNIHSEITNMIKNMEFK